MTTTTQQPITIVESNELIDDLRLALGVAKTASTITKRHASQVEGGERRRYFEGLTEGGDSVIAMVSDILAAHERGGAA